MARPADRLETLCRQHVVVALYAFGSGEERGCAWTLGDDLAPGPAWRPHLRGTGRPHRAG